MCRTPRYARGEAALAENEEENTAQRIDKTEESRNASSDDRNEDREPVFSAAFLLYVAFLFLPFLLYLTWPVGLFFTGSGIGWAFLRKRDGPFTKASKSFLGAVTWGLGAVSLLVLMLNLLASDKREFLAKILYSLASLRDSVFGIYGKFTLGRLFFVLLFLLILTYFYPHLRLVSRFLFVKKLVSTGLLVLTVITSFSLGAEVPIRSMLAGEHQKLVIRFGEAQTRYERALKSENEHIATELAARSVEQAIERVTPADVERIVEFLNRHYRYTSDPSYENYRHKLHSYFLDHVAKTASKNVRRSLGRGVPSALARPRTISEVETSFARSSSIVEPVPKKLVDLEDQKDTVLKVENLADKQSERAKKADLFAQQATSAATELFSKLIAPLLPDLGELPTAYIKKLLKVCTETIFRHIRAVSKNSYVVLPQDKRERERAAMLFTESTEDLMKLVSTELPDDRAYEQFIAEKRARTTEERWLESPPPLLQKEKSLLEIVSTPEPAPPKDRRRGRSKIVKHKKDVEVLEGKTESRSKAHEARNPKEVKAKKRKPPR